MEEVKPEAKPNSVVTLVIHCDVSNGKVDIGGHMDNLYLNLQMLTEAGHILIERNARLIRDSKGNGH